MYNFIRILIILGICMPSSFIGAQNTEQLSKKQKKELDFLSTKSLIENQRYIFHGETALSSDSRTFRLDPSTNFVRVYQKMAQIQLYYFGNSSSPNSALGDDQNIVFTGLVENIEVKINEKKKRVSIRFNANTEIESFDVTIQVSCNGYGTVNIYSNLRDRMRYNGKLMLPGPIQ